MPGVSSSLYFVKTGKQGVSNAAENAAGSRLGRRCQFRPHVGEWRSASALRTCVFSNTRRSVASGRQGTPAAKKESSRGRSPPAGSAERGYRRGYHGDAAILPIQRRSSGLASAVWLAEFSARNLLGRRAPGAPQSPAYVTKLCNIMMTLIRAQWAHAPGVGQRMICATVSVAPSPTRNA